MGDIFVISDIHLGDGGPRDNFEVGNRASQLHRFVDHVGAEGGELFILGDLFELWQMNISRLFLKRLELLDHFATVPLIYVPGNHDVDLLHFIGTEFLAHPFFTHMKAPFERTLGGRRFHFFHGHEMDPFNNDDGPGFGRMLTIFAGIFEDQVGSPLLASGEPVETVLTQFGESMMALWSSALANVGVAVGVKKDLTPLSALTPAQKPDRLSEHVTGVRTHRQQKGYDVAILGHTHQSGHIEDWYHNSGSWVGKHNSYLRIDPEGVVHHCDWTDGRPVEHHARPVMPAEPIAPTNPIRVATASVRTLFARPVKPDGSRWILIAQGALSLLVGIWALILASREDWRAGLNLLSTAFGLYAIADGMLALLMAPREHPTRRLLDRGRGVASMLLGLVILVRADTPEVLALLVGAWALVIGLSRFAAAKVLRGIVASRWLAIVGAASMVAGLGLLLLPGSIPMLKYALSTYLCLYGVAELLAGIFGKTVGRTRVRGITTRWRLA